MTNETPEQPRIHVVAMPNHKPVMTYTILGITVFVFILQIATLYGLKTDIPLVLGLKINELIVAGQYWRLFTPMLLHDDNIPFLHIIFNMYFLAVVGARLEKFTGPWAFLLLYVVAGFAGNVFSFLFSPENSLGASTALYGLMSTQIIFILHNRSFLANDGKPALQNALTLLIINVVLTLVLSSFMDTWGHFGGLAGGALFAWFGGVKLDLEEIAFPRFRLVDARKWRERLFAAGLVMAVFGGFAVLKITGLAF